MIYFFLILVLVIIVSYLIKNKIVIRFDTLFCKGFKVQKDTYGVYSFNRQTRFTEKLFPQFLSLIVFVLKI